MIAFVLWLLFRNPAPVEQSIDYGESSGGGGSSGGGNLISVFGGAGGGAGSGGGLGGALGALGGLFKAAQSLYNGLKNLLGGGGGSDSDYEASDEPDRSFSGGLPIPADEQGQGPGIGYAGPEFYPSLFDESAALESDLDEPTLELPPNTEPQLDLDLQNFIPESVNESFDQAIGLAESTSANSVPFSVDEPFSEPDSGAGFEDFSE